LVAHIEGGKYRLMVFGNRVLREIFGPKKDKVTAASEDSIVRSLMICTPHQILFGCSSQGE
jgi:hypothetical protein